MAKQRFSIIILTLNEEESISRCLKACRKVTNQLFVLDSCSTDRTVEIALEHGATVETKRFLNFSDQWNYALSIFPINTEYTIKIDADEEISDKLATELLELNPDESLNAFSIRRRLHFLGRRLNIVDMPVRVWRTGSVRFSPNAVNEQPEFLGRCGTLTHELIHHDSPSVSRWILKQDRYTTLEIQTKPSIHTRSLVRPDVYFRSILKLIFYKVPFRYTLLSFYYLFVRGLIVSGKPGFLWVRSRILVYSIIELKAFESKIIVERQQSHGQS